MYCDDLCIFLKGNNLTDIQIPLQSAVNSVQYWASQTGFKFSENKTVAMLFTRKYRVPPPPEISLNGEILQ